MYNLAEQTITELISILNERYTTFMENLEINESGLLGKISNSRYRDLNLRFSGMPYVGSKYTNAKKKILFVGLDIGIDECRESNSFHDFDSRRQCIAGSIEGCTTLGYNDHISGTYAMALYLLQKHYSWEEEWKKLSNINDQTLKTAIYKLIDILPNDVLDYVALTNIHKTSLRPTASPQSNSPLKFSRHLNYIVLITLRSGISYSKMGCGENKKIY